MNIDSIIAPYGRTVVRLLKGPVEVTDTNAWEDILNYQSEINKYLSSPAAWFRNIGDSDNLKTDA